MLPLKTTAKRFSSTPLYLENFSTYCDIFAKKWKITTWFLCLSNVLKNYMENKPKYLPSASFKLTVQIRQAFRLKIVTMGFVKMGGNLFGGTFSFSPARSRTG